MAFADNNIIPVQLDYRFVTTRKIWQYDYGQILSITGQNLPTATEVHFSLDIRGGSTLSRVGTTIDGVTTVKIPDELLKNNGKSGDFSIYAFIYVTDEESGNTEYRITIPVYSRPKPENPSVDPAPEPNIFHETVTAVNNAADRAEKAAKDTEQIRDNLNLDLSEKITRPQSAKVGQVIAVKEVGTDGKPTDFEAKDMTGGASTEEIKEAVGAYMQEHPFEETDPTVPDWAKRPEKPTYTAEDVGALPDNTKIPTKTSELENDSGFLTEHQDISGKLDSPPNPEVGKILKIKSVNEDGTFTCEWADDGGSNLDVRINGESIVQDGVVEIPVAGYTSPTQIQAIGLVCVPQGYGISFQYNTHNLIISNPLPSLIDGRNNMWQADYYALTLRRIDYAVKAAMCDGKGTAWTADEQAAARERMGIISEDDFELIATVNPSKEEIVSSMLIDLAKPIKANFYIVCNIGITDKSLNYVNIPRLQLTINDYTTWMYQPLQKNDTELRYMLMQIPICKKSGLVILSNHIPINNDFQSGTNLVGNGLGIAPYSDRNYSKGITKINIVAKDNYSAGYFSKNTVFTIYGKRI